MDLKADQSTDTRQKIYQDLHSEQLSEQEAANAVWRGMTGRCGIRSYNRLYWGDGLPMA